jgi:disulfide bond formation protein DsbB
MTAASPLSRPGLPALFVAAGSAATLGAALLSQYVGGLAPCVLCIWQRWPHVAAIALAGMALLALPRSRVAGAGLLALAGVALSGWSSTGGPGRPSAARPAWRRPRLRTSAGW